MSNFLERQDKWARVFLLLLYDVLAILISEFAAIYVRYEFSFRAIPRSYLEMLWRYSIINIVLSIAIFKVMQLYNSLWKYASVIELCNVAIACVVSTAVQAVGMYLMDFLLPRSYFVFYLFFILVLGIGGRFSYRFLRTVKRSLYAKHRTNPIRTMVIGAGEAGSMIINELKYSYHLNNEVLCIIDDNKKLVGSTMNTIPIVGTSETIQTMVEKYKIQEIMIAIPSLSQEARKKLLDICDTTNCKMKILPGTYQLIREDVSVSQLREVEIEDLLGRAPIETKLDEVLGYVKGKTILVTGGGGSIGSELCRQIANNEPKQLVIVDVYENNAYDIQLELQHDFPELNLKVRIASVRNSHKIKKLFEEFRPDIVYHAAAHKHVPLMEDSPNEAIKNNVYGTLNVAVAADQYQAKKMILISTDKAVNPTNIMGASKRMCEMIIQAYQEYSKTQYVAVRFGNVLGSNGSVIPLFKKQILAGGPVTVTDKNIIRYFMTISEAVALVLQAGAYAKGGEIFVLDMGDPVRIDDLAKRLIKKSGFHLGKDMDIVYTGLRPGEKLYEELLMNETGLTCTQNPRIHIGGPIDFDGAAYLQTLVELKDEVYEDKPTIKERISQIVPTYQVYREKEEGEIVE